MSDSRLQYWAKSVSLIAGALAGVLALVPQVASIFGDFDYTGEVLLVIFVIGMTFFGIGIIRQNPFRNSEQPLLVSQRVIGTILILVSPILAFVLWYTVLRLPPDVAEQVKTDVALGDTELLILNAPGDAITDYRNALALAPHKGSIRVKIQNAEERLRTKGE